MNRNSLIRLYILLLVSFGISGCWLSNQSNEEDSETDTSVETDYYSTDSEELVSPCRWIEMDLSSLSFPENEMLNFRSLWVIEPNKLYIGAESGFLHYDGENWHKLDDAPSPVRSIWGSSSETLYLGRGSLDSLGILQQGEFSTMVVAPVPTYLWGVSDTELYGAVVHEPGIQIIIDGVATYHPLSTPKYSVHSIWGTSSSNIYTVADDKVYHFDGANFSLSWQTSESAVLSTVFGFDEENIFAIGTYYATGSKVDGVDRGIMAFYDGHEWSEIDTPEDMNSLYTMWGVDPDNIFIVVDGNKIYHYNGAEFSLSFPEIPNINITKVWGVTEDSTYALGMKEGLWPVVYHYKCPTE